MARILSKKMLLSHRLEGLTAKMYPLNVMYRPRSFWGSKLFDKNSLLYPCPENFAMIIGQMKQRHKKN